MAAIMLLPAIVCAYYGERDGVEAFALTILAMVVFSVCSILYGARSKELRISRRDSFLAVTLAWVVLSLFGALPYHLTGALNDAIAVHFVNNGLTSLLYLVFGTSGSLERKLLGEGTLWTTAYILALLILCIGVLYAVLRIRKSLAKTTDTTPDCKEN